MPRVRQKASRSLKELCLQSISSNIDTVWCREFLEKYHGKAHYLFVLGPFDDLPPSLIHDVWTALKQRKFLRKHHCYLLISPYLKTLNLSNCEENLGLSLQLSQQRCYQLEGLDLSHNKLPKDLTLTSLPALTNLTSLSFSFSTVTNHQLSVCGVYLSRLASLDLSYCRGVSDSGLLPLLLARDLSGAPDPRFGQCRGLKRLKVGGCQDISPALSVRQALLSLPGLELLDHPETVSVIHSLDLQGSLATSLGLRSLHSGLESSEESLAVACRAAVRAEHVFTVLHPAQPPHCLLALLDLQTLRELHVREENSGEGGEALGPLLAPVLSRHGETLVSLNIAECGDLSLAVICSACPALIHLALLWNKNYLSSHSDSQFFPALRTAVFAFRPEDDGENYVQRQMSSSDLSLVLGSSSLLSLKLGQSQHLTDQLFTTVYCSNPMENLQSLELDQCHNISLECLEPLLENHNSLENCSFIKCEQITRRDIQRYQKKVNKLKWNMSINWS